jgi:hypothetical protein
VAADLAAPPARLVSAVGAALVGLGIAGCGAASPDVVHGPVDVGRAPVTVAAATAAPGPLPADRSGLRAAEVALPTLDVRSRLVDLDVGPDGALQAPPDPAVAGWYVHGATPGEPGPTVLAGHVDSRTGPAVFHRLDALAPGDRVEVTRSDGQVFAYRVATVEQHPKSAFPTARVYGPTPGPELHLITCGGDFDRSSRHYRDNVVVTAIPL